MNHQHEDHVRDGIWKWASTGIAAILFIVAAVMGFVVFPYAQGTERFETLWDSICSAAGLPRRPSNFDTVEPAFKVSQVDLSKVKKGEADAVGRGATLALQCAICHGPTGVSRADSPNLAGQYAGVIYKQLRDFKSGARTNAVMSPFAINMTERDMQDLAAYYSYLPSVPANSTTTEKIPAIVEFGAPMRGVAPCGACHGSIESKAGSPWLGGQPRVYIEAQIRAFASGGRTNDTTQQMRNVARQMTTDEVSAAARYYASLKPKNL